MRYLLLLLIPLFLASCEDDKTPCTDSDISICFEGFDSTDLADIEVRIYEQGSGFSQATETIYTGYSAEHTQSLSNSCENFPPFLDIDTEKDYEIIFRNTPEQVYRLQDIQMYRTEKNQEKAACYNNVSYYTLDGEQVDTDHYSGSIIKRDYNIVIEKR